MFFAPSSTLSVGFIISNSFPCITGDRLLTEISQKTYSQDTELEFLYHILEYLENKTIIDIGAEKGVFVQAFVDKNCKSIYAFEPYPPHVNVLRSQFNDVPSVYIHEIAVGVRDETATLHLAHDKTTGESSDFYNSILSLPDTPVIHWAGGIPVQVRSLASLIDGDTIPSEIGILKIDAEGSDFSIIQGMGRLFSAVIMVEYWDRVVEMGGSSPYTLADVNQVLQDRGYSNFIVLRRQSDFESIQLNSLQTQPGDWGNIIFIHDSVFP